MMSKYIQDKRDEEGFTLIELLVVVIIIGILAAIAIPVFLNQRENAWRSSLQANIQAVVTQTEVQFTNDAENYEEATDAALTDVSLPDEVTLTAELYGAAGAEGYCIEGTDTRLPEADGTYSQEMRGTALASIENEECPA